MVQGREALVVEEKLPFMEGQLGNLPGESGPEATLGG